jgi:hypothetical protein
VSGFQLILLADVKRPARATAPSGGFTLIPFQSRAAMAAEPRQEAAAEPWLTPKEAAEYAAKCVGQRGAYNAILERLKAGMIEAVARQSSTVQWGGAPYVEWGEKDIPKDLWTDFQADGSDLWGAGDAKFNRTQMTFLFIGIRLNPNDVKSTLPTPVEPKRWIKRKAPPPAPAPAKPPAEPEQKGPRVSDAHLAAWFDLYKQVYKGAEDTEDNALKSAQGMFLGKSVSRDRVRALRGSQKRGRKPVEPAK